jgi:hypothetical protein
MVRAKRKVTVWAVKSRGAITGDSYLDTYFADSEAEARELHADTYPAREIVNVEPQPLPRPVK